MIDYLNHFLPYYHEKTASFYGQSGHPLRDCSTYILNSPGKKIRAQLCLAVCEHFGGELNKALSSAFALELVHAYTLVHDDLPCMDDDAMRRGQPSAHIAFGEAYALLCGDSFAPDALLNIMQDPLLSAEEKVSLAEVLTESIGFQGIVYGQALDLQMTGLDTIDTNSLDFMKKIHLLKTGMLFGACTAMGAICASANKSDLVQRAKAFGQKLGVAFQVQDDFLDIDPANGKTAAKDIKQKKLTALRTIALKNKDSMVPDLFTEAFDMIKLEKDTQLYEFCKHFIIERSH